MLFWKVSKINIYLLCLSYCFTTGSFNSYFKKKVQSWNTFYLDIIVAELVLNAKKVMLLWKHCLHLFKLTTISKHAKIISVWKYPQTPEGFNDVFNNEQYRWSSQLKFHPWISKQVSNGKQQQNSRCLWLLELIIYCDKHSRFTKTVLTSWFCAMKLLHCYCFIVSQEVKPRYSFMLNFSCSRFTSPLRQTEDKLKCQKRK